MQSQRRHQPTKVVQCTACPMVYMTVGHGPGATDVRLAFPRPVSLDKYGYAETGICPVHPHTHA